MSHKLSTHPPAPAPSHQHDVGGRTSTALALHPARRLDRLLRFLTSGNRQAILSLKSLRSGGSVYLRLYALQAVSLARIFILSQGCGAMLLCFPGGTHPTILDAAWSSPHILRTTRTNAEKQETAQPAVVRDVLQGFGGRKPLKLRHRVTRDSDPHRHLHLTVDWHYSPQRVNLAV